MSSFAEWPGRWRHRRCSVLVGFNAFLGANDGIIWIFFYKKVYGLDGFRSDDIYWSSSKL
jgi:hypothetical protein